MSALRARRMVFIDFEWSVAIVAIDPQSGAEVDVYLTHGPSGSRIPPSRNVLPSDRASSEMIRLSRLVTDPLWPVGTYAATGGVLGSPR